MAFPQRFNWDPFPDSMDVVSECGVPPAFFKIEQRIATTTGKPTFRLLVRNQVVLDNVQLGVIRKKLQVESGQIKSKRVRRFFKAQPPASRKGRGAKNIQ